MPAYGHAMPGGAEIAFRCCRVLLIAEVIADVSEQFYKRDSDVCGVALLPIWQDDAQAVEHELSKAGKVFRQVIDARFGAPFRWADALCSTIEVAWTFDLERKIYRREKSVKPGGRVRVALACYKAQRVGRIVARPVHFHRQDVVLISRADRRFRYRHIAYALAALDHHVVWGQRACNGFEHVHKERALAVGLIGRGQVKHLKKIDAVQAAMISHLDAAAVITAEVNHR